MCIPSTFNCAQIIHNSAFITFCLIIYIPTAWCHSLPYLLLTAAACLVCHRHLSELPHFTNEDSSSFSPPPCTSTFLPMPSSLTLTCTVGAHTESQGTWFHFHSFHCIHSSLFWVFSAQLLFHAFNMHWACFTPSCLIGWSWIFRSH